MECKWVFPEFLDTLTAKVAEYEESDPDLYNRAMKMIKVIELWILTKGVTFCNFAFTMEGVLKNQSDYYLENYNSIKRGIFPRAEEIVDALTLSTNQTLTMPLAAQFKMTAVVHDFLSSTFLTTIIFLAILASMLVFSLMLADVDGKTYEYGMLRALGFMKQHLMLMITLGSFSFSIPGLFFGVIVAFLINLGLREVIFLEAKNTLDYNLTTMALTIGISFGFLMPFLANYLPIKSAMDKTLRNSLDLNKRKGDKFGVKVEKLENIGMSFNQFVIAIMLTGIGFMTYYFIPLAFINEHFALVFLLLSLILQLVVLGLTFLCTLLFPFLERILLWLTMKICCRRDRRLYTVVVKNMDGHSRRNNKTSIMFSLATAFLIFSSSSFKVISSVILDISY